MIDVRQITFLHETTVKLWHRQEIVNPYRDFLYQVCEQHKFNFMLWHEHDLARCREASDEQIAGVKRAIDAYNQQRNDWVERLDEHLKRMLDDRNIRPTIGAKHNSETPGSIIDRLSILSLRMFHLDEQLDRTDATMEHLAKVRDRLSILNSQHEDLSSALSELVADLAHGRKRLKLYRQFKMYNDPNMIPSMSHANDEPMLLRAA